MVVNSDGLDVVLCKYNHFVWNNDRKCLTLSAKTPKMTKMKVKITKTAVLATLLLLLSCPLMAQEQNGFKAIDIHDDFQENAFNWFRDALLLCAGDEAKSNAMTIGWGALGTLWGRPAVTVYVAEKRYTKVFMDKAQYFTVMSFDTPKILDYMGRNSGRDGDKAKALGLHTAYTANGTPYYTEADMVIECKLEYAAPFNPEGFKSEVPKRMYSRFPAGIHTMYIGEVVGAWQKGK